jgi:hypothetical protein
VRRCRLSARLLVGPLVVVALAAGLAAAAQAQILPPIYKPLPVEEGARHLARADSLRVAGQEAQTRAESLQEGARTLRQNGSGVVERLREEVRKLTEQASRVESQARVDAQTASALRGQAAEFERQAAERERRAEDLRAEIGRLQPGEGEEPDGAARLLELQAEVRAESQTAAAFREQVGELTGRARTLELAAGAAGERSRDLRQQEAQLQGYALEIAGGRGVNEATAARLDQEARVLRQSAERLSREAREQVALADAFRVQADRVLLPARDRVEAMRFFGEDGRSLLRSLVFTLGEGRGAGSINSELVSDYAGPVRVGVGFVLAESREASEEEPAGEITEADRRAAVERFYAGGGNLVVYSMMPLLFQRSQYHSVTVQALNKLAADLPGRRHAAAAGSVPANLDLGMEVYGTFNTFDARIKAFGLARSGVVVGNGVFQRNLGLEGRVGLPYTQVTFGAEMASVAKVLLSGARGPEGLGRELSLTFQVAPSRN